MGINDRDSHHPSVKRMSEEASIDFLCKSKNRKADRIKKFRDSEIEPSLSSPMVDYTEDAHDGKALEREMVFWNEVKDDRWFEDIVEDLDK